MTVYVDDMRANFGRMVMCHMLADTDEELHLMAARIGVRRTWWQSPAKTSGSHYDIALSKRAIALTLGATEISWRQAGAMNLRRKVTGALGAPEEAVQWVRDWRAAQPQPALPFGPPLSDRQITGMDSTMQALEPKGLS